MSSHEPLQMYRKVRPSTDRRSGLVIGAVLAVVAPLPLWRGGEVRWWAVGIAAALAAVALLRPALLGPLNRGWFALGNALQKVVSPVLMAILYFGAVTPVGLLMRLFGKTALRLKYTDAATYWIPREPPGPKAGTMSKQF